MRAFTLLHQGDRGEALCPECKGWRETEFVYRTVRLTPSGTAVPDVLAGVCLTCGTIATIPQQSAPKLREALAPAPTRIDVRIPKELRDLIGMIAAELDADPEAFAGSVLRYYFAQLSADKRLARRIGRLANSRAASGTPGGRIALRLSKPMLEAALASVTRTHAGVDQSALVRGVLVAAKEDFLERPVPTRQADLRAIALAGV